MPFNFNLNFSKKTLPIVALAMTALVLTCLIYVFGKWQKDWELAHHQHIPPKKTSSAVNSTNLINTLPKKHIFGQNLANTGIVPISNLQLSVTGIVKVDTPNKKIHSKAYISIAGEPSKIYQIGDSVTAGANIYDILPNAVIVDNNGHLEKLPLARQELEFKPLYEGASKE